MFVDEGTEYRRFSLEVLVFVAVTEFVQCRISDGSFGDYHVIGSLVPNSGGETKEPPRGIGHVRAQLVSHRKFSDGAGLW